MKVTLMVAKRVDGILELRQTFRFCFDIRHSCGGTEQGYIILKEVIHQVRQKVI